MKKIVLFGMFFLSVLSLNAQDKKDAPWQTEHKGIDVKVRGGYSIGLGDAKGSDMYNIEATVGKRFDNMFFGLSSGAWVYTESGSDAIIPITVDWEAFYTKGRITPTSLLRFGFGINMAKDMSFGKEKIKMPNFLIVQAMPGIRLGISRSVDLDLNVGISGLSSVGGSKGMGGKTSVYLSFGGSLNFHKSTNPGSKKPKKPTRERGLQFTFEGGKVAFNADEGDYYGGCFAGVLTYKFDHHLSAGIGAGGDFVDGVEVRGQYLKTTADGEKVMDEGIWYSLESIPKVFIRGQYNLTKKRFSPFVACDAGIRFYQYDSRDDDSEKFMEAKKT